MQIVVLDGYTLNPGDLSWEPLERLGPTTIYDRSEDAEVVARAAEAEIVLTNKTVLSAEVLARLPKLRYIGVLATGCNVVDLEAASAHGIIVSNVPTYGSDSVAQMVFAHLLNLTQHVAEHAAGVREGRWSQTPDFCYWDFPLLELAGRTMGIVGFGRIGQAVARMAAGFGMRVLAFDPRPIEPVFGAVQVDLDTLFRESDVVSLNCPLTPQTAKLLNRERLGQMKRTALVINTCRGGVVDEEALVEALNSGRIAGAGLDVLTVEPPPADHPLFSARNCYVTPHIAWATRAARSRLLDCAVGNVKAFLEGRPENVVAGMTKAEARMTKE